MKTFGLPVLLWLFAIVGLTLMLLADGPLELLGLVLLSTPLWAIARQAWLARRR